MKNNKSHRTGVSIPILIGTSRTSPITDQSLQMSFHLSHPKRISKYFFQPFKKKQNKTPNTQADTKMRVKLNNDNGLQGRTTRTTGYNTVLAKKGLTEVIEQLYYYQLLCVYSTDGFQMPPLRQYPKRCL